MSNRKPLTAVEKLKNLEAAICDPENVINMTKEEVIDELRDYGIDTHRIVKDFRDKMKARKSTGDNMKEVTFRQELAALLNKCGKDPGTGKTNFVLGEFDGASKTADHILAEFIVHSWMAFERSIKKHDVTSE